LTLTLLQSRTEEQFAVTFEHSVLVIVLPAPYRTRAGPLLLPCVAIAWNPNAEGKTCVGASVAV